MSAQNVVSQIDNDDKKVLVRSFDNLPEIKYLDSVANSVKKIKRFNSILGCITQLNKDETNPTFTEHLYQRLKDISMQLFFESKPLIILYNKECNSRVEEIELKGRLYPLKFVCEDQDGCMVSKNVDKGYTAFSEQTRRLLRIKEN